MVKGDCSGPLSFFTGKPLEVFMRNSRRHVNKSRSAAKFRHQSGRTKSVNVRPAPMRGGYRL